MTKSKPKLHITAIKHLFSNLGAAFAAVRAANELDVTTSMLVPSSIPSLESLSTRTQPKRVNQPRIKQ